MALVLILKFLNEVVFIALDPWRWWRKYTPDATIVAPMRPLCTYQSAGIGYHSQPPVTSRRLPLPWRHRGSNDGSFPFTPLQYMRMMLIFTKRWRLHYGRNPCRLWFDALFKYSSFSNRPSHAKGNLKSKTIWTSNWLLQETVKDILPLGGNSFTISY